MSSSAERIARFHELHQSGCFMIPNPWDAGSARALAGLGFKALATTSAGLAWSMGRRDKHLTLDEVLAHLRLMVDAVDLPVSADFEGGYATAPATVAGNVRLALDTGIAGISIEDSPGDPSDPLFGFSLAVERIAATRRAIDDSGTDVLLCARSEGFMVGRPDIGETVRRLTAYAGAGADCVYAPGLHTRDQVSAIVDAVAPTAVNVVVGNHFTSVAELAALGVRRISVGGALARSAWTGFLEAAREMVAQETFASLHRAVTYVDVNNAIEGTSYTRTIESSVPAMPERLSSRAVRFSGFVLDLSAYELRRDDRTIKVERRPMELLMLLVDRRGELVTRDEIVARLWGRDVFIDVDSGVNTVIRKIRRALRDSAEESRFIQTVPGKGYRFIADVESATGAVLAVLPFENLQGHPDQDYVADGLTEETIVGLGQIDPERLSVIGRTSCMAYRRTSKALTEIGRELGADYLVEGSIRGARGRLRVASKLIRVRDQVQVWTETYERDSNDLLGLQVELGGAIARQIELRLSPQRTDAIGRRQTRNPEAYDLYLRGRYLYDQMTPATAARALDCFRRATVIDRTYALAWAGIADTYSSRVFASDTRSSDVSDDARQAAVQALQHGDQVAEVYTAVARVQFLFDWDWRGAEANLRRALALDPSSAQSHWMLGHALSQQQRHDQALAAAKRARELDPRDALSHSMSSQIAYSARDLQAAVEHAGNALLAEPDFWVAYWQLGQAYQRMGRTELALDALTEASRLSNGNSKPISMSAYALARSGRAEEARAVLVSLESRSARHYVPPMALALVGAGLNDDEAMFSWLERALAVRDAHLIYLAVDPNWDLYREDRRFQDLVLRCGF